ncbi:MAG TPA: hypothetical protein VME69_00405 [Methylocella sp.]|nr:hypothetical protein [Methylocella sp.]
MIIAGSICVVRVVQGKATEGYHRIAADGFVDLEYEEVMRAGEVKAFQDAGVQTVRNASPAGEVNGMFIVGTLRKPASWESTAVPELREQAAAVAQASDSAKEVPSTLHPAAGVLTAG